MTLLTKNQNKKKRTKKRTPQKKPNQSNNQETRTAPLLGINSKAKHVGASHLCCLNHQCATKAR